MNLNITQPWGRYVPSSTRPILRSQRRSVRFDDPETPVRQLAARTGLTIKAIRELEEQSAHQVRRPTTRASDEGSEHRAAAQVTRCWACSYRRFGQRAGQCLAASRCS